MYRAERLFLQCRDKIPLYKSLVFYQNHHVHPMEADDLVIKRCRSVHDMERHVFEKLCLLSGDMADQLLDDGGLPPGKDVWLGLRSGNLVGVCWSSSRCVSHYFVPLTACDSLLKAATVDFQYRGQGIYPVILTRVTNSLLEEGQHNIFIDCKMTNKASIRGIKKAGFIFAGSVWNLEVGSKRLIFMNKCNEKTGSPRT